MKSLPGFTAEGVLTQTSPKAEAILDFSRFMQALSLGKLPYSPTTPARQCGWTVLRDAKRLAYRRSWASTAAMRVLPRVRPLCFRIDLGFVKYTAPATAGGTAKAQA